jgi:hypothetical protein
MRDFHYTVNVLVKAYLNDTLIHGHPCGCAVGNLIAQDLGLKVIVEGSDQAGWIGGRYQETGGGFDWFTVVRPDRIVSKGSRKLGVQQIKATGYSVNEIRRIEHAFESVQEENDLFNPHLDPDGHKGLMAVVDVLAEIHNIDLSTKEEAKKAFVKTSS